MHSLAAIKFWLCKTVAHHQAYMFLGVPLGLHHFLVAWRVFVWLILVFLGGLARFDILIVGCLVVLLASPIEVMRFLKACNAPRPMLQPPSMFFVVVVCFILLLLHFIMSSCILHPHVFINLVDVRSCRFSLCLHLSFVDLLSLSISLKKNRVRVRNFFETRPGQSSPLDSDHPPNIFSFLFDLP